MRHLMLAAALAIPAAALAQAGDQPTTQAPAPAASSGTPERDARGIPVVSDPATAPAGANQPVPSGNVVVSPNQQAVFAAQPSSKEYPVCSKTVTDGCVQSYERGRRPG